MRNRIFISFLFIATLFFVGCGEKINNPNNNGGGMGKNGLFPNGSPIGCTNMTINKRKVNVDNVGLQGAKFLKQIKASNIEAFRTKSIAWTGCTTDGFDNYHITLNLWQEGESDLSYHRTMEFSLVRVMYQESVKPGLKLDIERLTWYDSNLILTDDDYIKWSANYYDRVNYGERDEIHWWKDNDVWKVANHNLSGSLTVVSINEEYATVTLKFDNFVMGTNHDDVKYPINPYPLFTFNGLVTIPFTLLY